MDKPTARITLVEVVQKERKNESLKLILDYGKGEILKEFEKVCPTDKSFARMKKDMHDIFDEMTRRLQEK
jgi:DNA-binding IscR family transcriptional regulator